MNLQVDAICLYKALQFNKLCMFDSVIS